MRQNKFYTPQLAVACQKACATTPGNGRDPTRAREKFPGREAINPATGKLCRSRG
jgi:hypothetical protein